MDNLRSIENHNLPKQVCTHASSRSRHGARICAQLSLIMCIQQTLQISNFPATRSSAFPMTPPFIRYHLCRNFASDQNDHPCFVLQSSPQNAFVPIPIPAYTHPPPLSSRQYQHIFRCIGQNRPASVIPSTFRPHSSSPSLSPPLPSHHSRLSYSQLRCQRYCNVVASANINGRPNSSASPSSRLSSSNGQSHHANDNPEHDEHSQVQDKESLTGDDQSPDRRILIAGFSISVLIIGGIVAVSTGLISKETLLSLTEWFATLGPNAIVLYSLLYFVLELVAVPALPLTLCAGYLFGVVKGTIAVSISSSLAAGVAFLIARYSLRDFVSKIAGKFRKFQAIDRAIGKEGFKFVFLLRLSPLLPFSISNYLYGLTSVDFVQFFFASWLGMLPGTFAYINAGAAVNALTDLESGKAAHVNPALIVLGTVGTIGVLWFVGQAASKAIADIEDTSSPNSNETDKIVN